MITAEMDLIHQPTGKVVQRRYSFLDYRELAEILAHWNASPTPPDGPPHWRYVLTAVGPHDETALLVQWPESAA